MKACAVALAVAVAVMAILAACRLCKRNTEEPFDASKFTGSLKKKIVTTLTARAEPLKAVVRWYVTQGEGRTYLFVDGEDYERIYQTSGELTIPVTAGYHTFTMAIYDQDPARATSSRTISVEVPCYPNHANEDGTCKPLDCEPRDQRHMTRMTTGRCQFADECTPGFRFNAELDECEAIPCPSTLDNRQQQRLPDGSCQPIEVCVDGHVVNQNNWSRGCIPSNTPCDPRQPRPNNVWLLNGTTGFCEATNVCFQGFVHLDGDPKLACVECETPCDPPVHPESKTLMERSCVTGKCHPTKRCAEDHVPLDGDVSKGCVPCTLPCEPDKTTNRLMGRNCQTGVCQPLDACVDDLVWAEDPYGNSACRADGDECLAPEDKSRGQRLEWRKPHAKLRTVSGIGSALACVALDACVDAKHGFYSADLVSPCKPVNEPCLRERPEGDSRPFFWTETVKGKVACLPTADIGDDCSGPNASVRYTYQRSTLGEIDCRPESCVEASHVPMDGDYAKGCVARDTCDAIGDYMAARNDRGFCQSKLECRSGLVPRDGDPKKGCVEYGSACAPVKGVAHARGDDGRCASSAVCADGLVPRDGVISSGCVPRDEPCVPRQVEGVLMERGSNGVCAKGTTCAIPGQTMNSSGACVTPNPCGKGEFLHDDGFCYVAGETCGETAHGVVRMSRDGVCKDVACDDGYVVDGSASGCVERTMQIASLKTSAVGRTVVVEFEITGKVGQAYLNLGREVNIDVNGMKRVERHNYAAGRYDVELRIEVDGETADAMGSTVVVESGPPGGPSQNPAAQNGGPSQNPAAQNGGPSQNPAAQNGGPSQNPAAQNGGPSQNPAAQNGGPSQNPAAQNGGPSQIPAVPNGGTSTAQNGGTSQNPAVPKGGPIYTKLEYLHPNMYLMDSPSDVVQAANENECMTACSSAPGCNAITFYDTGGYLNTDKKCKLMTVQQTTFEVGVSSDKKFSSWKLASLDWKPLESSPCGQNNKWKMVGSEPKCINELADPGEEINTSGIEALRKRVPRDMIVIDLGPSDPNGARVNDEVYIADQVYIFSLEQCVMYLGAYEYRSKNYHTLVKTEERDGKDKILFGYLFAVTEGEPFPMLNNAYEFVYQFDFECTMQLVDPPRKIILEQCSQRYGSPDSSTARPSSALLSPVLTPISHDNSHVKLFDKVTVPNWDTVTYMGWYTHKDQYGRDILYDLFLKNSNTLANGRMVSAEHIRRVPPTYDGTYQTTHEINGSGQVVPITGSTIKVNRSSVANPGGTPSGETNRISEVTRNRTLYELFLILDAHMSHQPLYGSGTENKSVVSTHDNVNLSGVDKCAIYMGVFKYQQKLYHVFVQLGSNWEILGGIMLAFKTGPPNFYEEYEYVMKFDSNITVSGNIPNLKTTLSRCPGELGAHDASSDRPRSATLIPVITPTTDDVINFMNKFQRAYDENWGEVTYMGWYEYQPDKQVYHLFLKDSSRLANGRMMPALRVGNVSPMYNQNYSVVHVIDDTGAVEVRDWNRHIPTKLMPLGGQQTKTQDNSEATKTQKTNQEKQDQVDQTREINPKPPARTVGAYTKMDYLGPNMFIDDLPLGGIAAQTKDGNGYVQDSTGVVDAADEGQCMEACSRTQGCNAITFYETGGYLNTGKKCKLMNASTPTFSVSTMLGKTVSSWKLTTLNWKPIESGPCGPGKKWRTDGGNVRCEFTETPADAPRPMTAELQRVMKAISELILPPNMKIHPATSSPGPKMHHCVDIGDKVALHRISDYGSGSTRTAVWLPAIYAGRMTFHDKEAAALVVFNDQMQFVRGYILDGVDTEFPHVLTEDYEIRQEFTVSQVIDTDYRDGYLVRIPPEMGALTMHAAVANVKPAGNLDDINSVKAFFAPHDNVYITDGSPAFTPATDDVVNSMNHRQKVLITTPDGTSEAIYLGWTRYRFDKQVYNVFAKADRFGYMVLAERWGNHVTPRYNYTYTTVYEFQGSSDGYVKKKAISLTITRHETAATIPNRNPYGQPSTTTTTSEDGEPVSVNSRTQRTDIVVKPKNYKQLNVTDKRIAATTLGDLTASQNSGDCMKECQKIVNCNAYSFDESQLRCTLMEITNDTPRTLLPSASKVKTYVDANLTWSPDESAAAAAAAPALPETETALTWKDLPKTGSTLVVANDHGAFASYSIGSPAPAHDSDPFDPAASKGPATVTGAEVSMPVGSGYKMQVALDLSDGSKAYLGVNTNRRRPLWYRGKPVPFPGAYDQSEYHFCAVKKRRNSDPCPKEYRLRVWLDPYTPLDPSLTMEKALPDGMLVANSWAVNNPVVSSSEEQCKRSCHSNPQCPGVTYNRDTKQCTQHGFYPRASWEEHRLRGGLNLVQHVKKPVPTQYAVDYYGPAVPGGGFSLMFDSMALPYRGDAIIIMRNAAGRYPIDTGTKVLYSKDDKVPSAGWEDAFTKPTGGDAKVIGVSARVVDDQYKELIDGGVRNATLPGVEIEIATDKGNLYVTVPESAQKILAGGMSPLQRPHNRAFSWKFPVRTETALKAEMPDNPNTATALFAGFDRDQTGMHTMYMRMAKMEDVRLAVWIKPIQGQDPGFRPPTPAQRTQEQAPDPKATPIPPPPPPTPSQPPQPVPQPTVPIPDYTPLPVTPQAKYAKIEYLKPHMVMTNLPLGGEAAMTNAAGKAVDSSGVVHASKAEDCMAACSDAKDCTMFTFYDQGGYLNTNKRCKLMNSKMGETLHAGVSPDTENKRFSTWALRSLDWKLKTQPLFQPRGTKMYPEPSSAVIRMLDALRKMNFIASGMSYDLMTPVGPASEINNTKLSYDKHVLLDYTVLVKSPNQDPWKYRYAGNFKLNKDITPTPMKHVDTRGKSYHLFVQLNEATGHFENGMMLSSSGVDVHPEFGKEYSYEIFLKRENERVSAIPTWDTTRSVTIGRADNEYGSPDTSSIRPSSASEKPVITPYIQKSNVGSHISSGLLNMFDRVYICRTKTWNYYMGWYDFGGSLGHMFLPEENGMIPKTFTNPNAMDIRFGEPLPSVEKLYNDYSLPDVIGFAPRHCAWPLKAVPVASKPVTKSYDKVVTTPVKAFTNDKDITAVVRDKGFAVTAESVEECAALCDDLSDCNALEFVPPDNCRLLSLTSTSVLQANAPKANRAIYVNKEVNWTNPKTPPTESEKQALQKYTKAPPYDPDYFHILYHSHWPGTDQVKIDDLGFAQVNNYGYELDADTVEKCASVCELNSEKCNGFKFKRGEHGHTVCGLGLLAQGYGSRNNFYAGVDESWDVYTKNVPQDAIIKKSLRDTLKKYTSVQGRVRESPGNSMQGVYDRGSTLNLKHIGSVYSLDTPEKCAVACDYYSTMCDAFTYYKYPRPTSLYGQCEFYDLGSGTDWVKDPSRTPLSNEIFYVRNNFEFMPSNIVRNTA